uniref:MyoD family inhibitor domain containing n=2 Tax=Nothobranchius TaxID=28779 RepID=A0A1A8AVQ6_NOTFU
MLPGKRLPVECEKEPSDATEAQPFPTADPPAAVIRQPQHNLQRSACPRCGLTVEDHKLIPVSQSLNRLQSSKSSARNGRSSNRSKASHQPAAAPTDSCFHLLLACLWCRCSVLLLGLLEAFSSSLQCLCSPCCCRACTCCCSQVQETPLEELSCHAHCHSVMFESCCEPVECLEFCLDCCEICHHN